MFSVLGSSVLTFLAIGIMMQEQPLVEAALEGTEVVVDTLIDSEILKSIPVVGTAVKLIKGAGQIRDRIFAAKIMRFLQTLDAVSPQLKDEIRKRVAQSPADGRRVGETVVLLLDRLSELSKAELLAILFVAYAYGHISSLDFQRLAHAVDSAFMDDLNTFLAASHNIGKKSPSTGGYLKALYPSGLTEFMGGKQLGTIGEIYFQPSSLGKKLMHAYSQGRRLCQRKQ